MSYNPNNPNGQATMANSAPVVIASNQSAVPTSTAQETVFRTTFASVIASGVDSNFFNTIQTGSGQTMSQSAGNLVMTSGTTANAETIIRSTSSFTGQMILRVQNILSQRIANNNFYIELVDLIGDSLATTVNSATSITVTIPSNPFTSANVGQSMYIGAVQNISATAVPGRWAIASVSGNNVTFTVAGWPASGSGTVSLFGWNYQQQVFTSTTATNVSWDTQRRGWNSGFTVATCNTTASPGTMTINMNTIGHAYLADQLVASTAGTAQITQRASRVVNLPDESATYYLQLRVANGSTAPASTTTWTLGMASVEAFLPQNVVVNDVKAQGAGNQLPVAVTNIPATTVNSGTITTVSTVTTLANGQTAHSAASTGSPVRVAGRVNTAVDTTLVAGDVSDLFMTTSGATTIKPFAVPEVDWSATSALTPLATTSSTTLKAAGAAGVRNYCTAIQLMNTSSTVSTIVTILDGATVLWAGFLPASTSALPQITLMVEFPTPLRGSAATAMNIQLGTTAASVYYNAQGYQAP